MASNQKDILKDVMQYMHASFHPNLDLEMAKNIQKEIQPIRDELNAMPEGEKKKEFILFEVAKLSNAKDAKSESEDIHLYEAKFNVLLKGLGYKDEPLAISTLNGGELYDIAKMESLNEEDRPIRQEMQQYLASFKLDVAGAKTHLKIVREIRDKLDTLPEGKQKNDYILSEIDKLLKEPSKDTFLGQKYNYDNLKLRSVYEAKFNALLKGFGYKGKPWTIYDLDPEKIKKKIYEEVILPLQQTKEALRVLDEDLKQPKEPYQTLLTQFMMGEEEPDQTKAKGKGSPRSKPGGKK